MGSVNISVKDDAYRFLKSLKREGKSFSDVILEFRGKRNERSGKSLLKFSGGLKDMNINWEGKAKRMKEFRESFERRIDETRSYMEKARRDKSD